MKTLIAEFHKDLRTDLRMLNRLAYFLLFGQLPRLGNRHRTV